MNKSHKHEYGAPPPIPTWMLRLTLLVMALVLIGEGALALYAEKPDYLNYFGGRVFPPVAIAGGIALLYFVVKPRSLARKNGRQR